VESSRTERFDALYRTAEAQSGFFTASQAIAAGYSQRLLTHHAHRNHVERWMRGIYRLVHFPQLTAAEDLVVFWLWSERQGTFSHTTALQRLGLSDAMPARASMTLPTNWAKRRLRVPPGLTLHFANVPDGEREEKAGVPITTAARTVNDCASASVEPDLVQQAVEEGLGQGLFKTNAIGTALAYLREQTGFTSDDRTLQVR
jgi:predicted transcriptional regulator of viral defense system